jgi:hypothetical protein
MILFFAFGLRKRMVRAAAARQPKDRENRYLSTVCAFFGARTEQAGSKYFFPQDKAYDRKPDHQIW